MENSDSKRSCLRGLECTIFDLVSGTKRWVEWLTVPLQHAAAAGDFRLVVQLQRAGANGNALRGAVGGGHVALVRYLVKRGASVTRKDKNGDSPLHLAADQGYEEIVSLLLEKGAPPNVLDHIGYTPLHAAAKNGHLAAVNILLAAGADTSLRYGKNGGSALDLAAAGGRVEIVAALVRSGANVNAEDPSGSTALHEAAHANEAGVIDVLVEAGADIGATNMSLERTALHCAADGCCVEAILALLRHGASVESPNRAGQSPIHLAAAQGHLPATEALLVAGADVNATDNGGNTALHLAATGGHQVVSRTLVQAGADVNAAGFRGRTALHNADTAMYRRAGSVRGLAEAGAAVNAQNGNERAPLLHMCLPTNIRLEPIAALLECGANANAQDLNGDVPLHLAASTLSRDGGDAVDLLLRWGADETAVNGRGRTPLQHARAKFFHVNSLGRLSDLLEQAPADRNWRRRCWLLLYRAYPLRMRPMPDTGAAPISDRPEKCRARAVSTGAAGGAHVVRGAAAGAGGNSPGDWSGVVTWVVGIGLEGVFRNVVKYL